MLAAGLDCRTESVKSGIMRIADAEIVKEYRLNVTRKSNVEGLEFLDSVDGGPAHLIMSTGSYGGFINLLELNASGEEWNLKNRVKVDTQFFGTGLTTLDSETYMLTWRSQKILRYNLDSLIEDGPGAG